MDERTEPSAPVVVEGRGRVAVVRINRPATRNALSSAVLQELEFSVVALSAREDLSAVVFTGAGDVFASGANIAELAELSPDAALGFALSGQRLFQMIEDAPQLTVAAVNGFCMGGGLDLALACDVRCASPSAVFAHPGLRLGIITGWGGTQRLPRLIGSARAFEMFLTGAKLDGRQAHEIGLVNYLDDDPFGFALRVAAKVRGSRAAWIH